MAFQSHIHWCTGTKEDGDVIMQHLIIGVLKQEDTFKGLKSQT